MPSRIAIAQNNHADRHQRKCKKRSDIREIGKRTNVQNPSRDTNHETGNPSSSSRRAIPGMHTSEQFRQQPVPRHGKPNPRLSKLKNQQRRNHPHHRPKQDAEFDPSQGIRMRSSHEGLQTVGHRSRIVQHSLPRHYAREHNRDANIEDGAYHQCGNNPDRQIALRIARLLRRG